MPEDDNGDSNKNKESSDSKEDKRKKKQKSAIEKATGIDPKDLLKAPIEPPNIKDDRPATNKQKGYFFLGIAILLIGAAFFAFSIYFAVAVGLIGLAIIIVSVLIRFD